MKRCCLPILRLLSVLFFICFAYNTVAAQTPEQLIRLVLETQVKFWNEGNIEEFMKGYDKTDSIRFASGGNVRRGWTTVLQQYKKSYPDKKTMGKLTFENLEIQLLCNDKAIVLGKWIVQAERGNSSGLFTLIFHKTRQGWKIIHDHTSSE